MKKQIWGIFAALIIFASSYIIYKLTREAYSLDTILKESSFAEIKPPNNLSPPGTIVFLDNKDPGILKVICPCENAFGKEVKSKWIESPSTDIEILNKLSGTFNVNLDFIKKTKLNPKFDIVKEISLKLSKVKIIEIPDDAVFELLNCRSPYCIEAIKKRVDAGQMVSLVKRVIQADAEYKITFSESVSETVKLEVTADLSLELLGTEAEHTENMVIGKQLFWGVDDDVHLGMLQPGQLPSTGSNLEKRITKPESSYRIEFDQISYNVSPIKQPNSMGCWITVYTMMQSWKRGEELRIDEILEELGEPWIEYYNMKAGLPANKVLDFIEAAKLNYLQPASYLPSVYADLLSEHGPIWITTGNGFNSHAKLLVGIYGDYTGEVSIMEFIDPATGNTERLDFLSFIDAYEKEAHFINSKRPDLSLRIQILYFQ